MSQPTNVESSKQTVWDEKNSKFVYEEISHLESLAVDSGTINEESAVLDMKKNTLAQFQIVEDSGDITDAVATLHHSVDGVTFVATAATVTNEGVSSQVEVGRYVKVVFGTPSTIASTSDVTIVGR